MSDTTCGTVITRGRLAYSTALICGASFFSYLDRAGLSILVEPIKSDLNLSDAQIGLLTGIAFSLTYALFGIPLARLTDTGNRTRLLAICLGVWSLADCSGWRRGEFCPASFDAGCCGDWGSRWFSRL
jgi:predicted MFS family arabinose efflux permease